MENGDVDPEMLIERLRIEGGEAALPIRVAEIRIGDPARSISNGTSVRVDYRVNLRGTLCIEVEEQNGVPIICGASGIPSGVRGPLHDSVEASAGTIRRGAPSTELENRYGEYEKL